MLPSYLKKLLPISFKDRHRDGWDRWKHCLNRPPHPVNADGKLYVHLGCGPIACPGFINIDAIPLAHVHHVANVERLDMLADGSVDLVYSSHCLEHISHLQVPKVLREWRRTLKSGGILRLSVPDFEKILDIYADNGQQMESIETVLLGGQDYAFNFHKSAYDKHYLTKRLVDAGFVNVNEWTPGSSELTTFDDWSGKKVRLCGKDYLISLNVEGQKP